MPLFLLCCVSYSAEDPDGHRVKYHSAERPENLCLSKRHNSSWIGGPVCIDIPPNGSTLHSKHLRPVACSQILSEERLT